MPEEEEIVKHEGAQGVSIMTDSMIAEAQKMITSGFLPETITTPEQAIIIMQTGRELGFPPMSSFANIFVVNGRPALSGQAVAGLLARSGVRTKVIKDNEPIYGAGEKSKTVVDRITTIEFTRDDVPQEISYKYSDAVAAGYTSKSNWKKYQTEMMYWRCLTRGARRVSPDSLLGLYEIGELVDSGAVNADTIILDENGNAEYAEGNDQQGTKAEKKEDKI